MIWTGECVDWVLPDRLEWTPGTYGRRFVSGSAPENDERRHSNVSSSAPFSVPPSLHVHLAAWRESRCMRCPWTNDVLMFRL